jgi:hypothetical protein
MTLRPVGDDLHITAAHEMAHVLMWEHYVPGLVERVVTDRDEDGNGPYVERKAWDSPRSVTIGDLVACEMAGWAAEQIAGEDSDIAEQRAGHDIQDAMNVFLKDVPSEDNKRAYILGGLATASAFLKEPSNTDKHKRLIELFLRRHPDNIDGEEVRRELEGVNH